MARLRRFYRLDGSYSRVNPAEYARRTKLQQAAVKRSGLHWFRNTKGRPAALTLDQLKRRQGWRDQAKRQRPPGSSRFRTPAPVPAPGALPPPPAPAGRFPLPTATIRTGADLSAWISRVVDRTEAAIAATGPVRALWSLDLRMEIHKPGQPPETVERRIPITVTSGKVGGGWLGTVATEAGEALADDDWRRRLITDIRAQGVPVGDYGEPAGQLVEADMTRITNGPELTAQTTRSGTLAASGTEIEVQGWIEYDTGEGAG